MADLDLDALVPPAFALALGFDVAASALGFDPGGEEGGGVEDALEVADGLSGGDGGGFIDGEEAFDNLRHGGGIEGRWGGRGLQMKLAMVVQG